MTSIGLPQRSARVAEEVDVRSPPRVRGLTHPWRYSQPSLRGIRSSMLIGCFNPNWVWARSVVAVWAEQGTKSVAPSSDYAASCGSFSLRRCNQRSNEEGLSDECLPSNSPSTPMSSSRSGHILHSQPGYLKISAFRGCAIGETGIPPDGNGNRAAVLEINRQRVVCDLYFQDPG